MPLFMIKYGKEEHLKQIVNGSIRFAPSQTYVKMEKILHNKGQGDLLDGKMKLKPESAKMYDYETNEIKAVIPNCMFTLSIQDVNDMPIFCISHYGSEDTASYESINKYKISLHIDKLNCIKQDFSEATHALIILEPDKFIAGVQAIKGHQIISDQIRYYNYDSNTLQMYMYLATGNTEKRTNETLTLSYENRYRHLLCKDIYFEKQQEYRFIVLDELITKPVFYQYDFASEYILVPIDKLKQEIDVEL
ncbi:UNVERIFIED_CONTAM: hypothetical protein Cloal_3161 [Acetivibrio alkalicellulosi]